MMNTSVKDLKKISTLPDEQGRREGTSRVPQLRESKNNYHSCQRSDITLKGTVSENKLSTARLVLEDNLQITNKAQLE